MNDNLLLSLIEGHQSISRNQDPFNVQTESFESRFDIKDHEKTPSFGQKSSNQRHHKKNNRITTNLTTRTWRTITKFQVFWEDRVFRKLVAHTAYFPTTYYVCVERLHLSWRPTLSLFRPKATKKSSRTWNKWQNNKLIMKLRQRLTFLYRWWWSLSSHFSKWFFDILLQSHVHLQ